MSELITLTQILDKGTNGDSGTPGADNSAMDTSEPSNVVVDDFGSVVTDSNIASPAGLSATARAEGEGDANIASDFNLETEPAEPSEPAAEPADPAAEPAQNAEPVDWEQRYLELQSSYTKSRQELAAYKVKANALAKQLENSNIQLDPEVAEELEQLKYTNPEAWRQKLNALENARAKEIQTEIDRQIEIDRRKELLAEYNAKNPHYQINDYVADYVLPRGIVNKLEQGEVSFESFLKEASDYLKRIKVDSQGKPVGPGPTANAGKQAPIVTVGGDSNQANGPMHSYDEEYANTIW